MLGWWRRRRGRRADADPWDTALLRHLSAADRKRLDPLVDRRTFAPGEALVEEGTPADDVYVVIAGTFRVTRREGQAEHHLRDVGVGDTVGESALFEGLPRRASVRATSPAEVLALRLDDLHREAARNRDLQRIYQSIVLVLAEQLAHKLQAQTDAYLEGAKRQDVMGRFVVNLLILLCCYVFLLSGLQRFGTGYLANTSMVSIPIQVVFGLGSWWFIRSTGSPASEFGLGVRHLLGSLVEATVLTPVALAAITGIKQLWLWARDDPSPLIAYTDVVARLRSDEVWPLLVVYALSSAVQELIVRGALQSSLESFLRGPHRKRHAIVVSGLLFAVTHLHMSFLFAALVLLPGMFWGWLFARRRNLVGVTLSHVVVGAYVFFILGITL